MIKVSDIKWLASISLSKAFIELDCKQMIDNIFSKLNANFMFAAILDICEASLRFFQNIKISFIREQTNNVLHLLAMTLLSYAGSHIHDNMLSCIYTIVIIEISRFCLCKKKLKFPFLVKKKLKLSFVM